MSSNPQVQRINEMIAAQEAAEKAALEAANTTVAEEVVPVQPPTEEAPVIEGTPEEVKDIAYYQRIAEEKAKESDNWQKRRKDAEKELLPALEERSLLKKQLQEAREKLAEIDSIKAELASLRNAPAKVSPLAELPSDFAETYPDIAEAMTKSMLSVKQEADNRFAELEKELRATKESRELAERQAFEAKHFNAVKTIHSDLGDFMGGKYGPALCAWSESQPPIFGNIIGNPAAYDPKDVAAVISQFKKETGYAKPVAQAKASAGDIGFKATSTSNPKVEQGVTILSDDEMRRLPEMFNRVKHDPNATKALLARLDATEAKMYSR